MDLTVTVIAGKAIPAIQTKLLREFVKEVARQLQAVTDGHLKAAGENLARLKNTENPRQAINRAIVHLESAYHILKEQHEGYWRKIFKNEKVAQERSEKILLCQTLILLCHHLLGDKKLIEEKIIVDLGDAFREYVNVWTHYEPTSHNFGAPVFFQSRYERRQKEYSQRTINAEATGIRLAELIEALNIDTSQHEYGILCPVPVFYY